MHLHLGGHLSWYDPAKRTWLEVRLAAPVPLPSLLEQLGIPSGEVAIVAINGRAAELENTLVVDADRVELYPPMGGGTG